MARLVFGDAQQRGLDLPFEAARARAWYRHNRPNNPRYASRLPILQYLAHSSGPTKKRSVVCSGRRWARSRAPLNEHTASRLQHVSPRLYDRVAGPQEVRRPGAVILVLR